MFFLVCVVSDLSGDSYKRESSPGAEGRRPAECSADSKTSLGYFNTLGSLNNFPLTSDVVTQPRQLLKRLFCTGATRLMQMTVQAASLNRHILV